MTDKDCELIDVTTNSDVEPVLIPIPKPMPTKDDILKAWLNWVEDNASWRESCGVMSCFFCCEEFKITKSVINHRDDCVYRLTEEYSHPTAEENE